MDKNMACRPTKYFVAGAEFLGFNSLAQHCL